MKPISYRKYKSKPLEGVKILAERYLQQRNKLVHTNRFFFQHFDSMQYLKTYIRFYGDIYRTSILFGNTRQNLKELDKKLEEVRITFGL